jgi:hypothetical protein
MRTVGGRYFSPRGMLLERHAQIYFTVRSDHRSERQARR